MTNDMRSLFRRVYRKLTGRCSECGNRKRHKLWCQVNGMNTGGSRV